MVLPAPARAGDADPDLLDERAPRAPHTLLDKWTFSITQGTAEDGPLMLLAAGSGVVRLRSMLRHRLAAGSDVQARLLYSSRTWEDVIYRGELGMSHESLLVSYTLTRSQPLAYICGSTSFVETAAAGLVALGYPPERVRTERFGATGGR
jgi:ferredoxin-NADP reductase